MPAPAGTDALPCLKEGNNCNEFLSGSQSNYRKTEAALQWNVEWFIKKHGIERVGFLTLTFAENIRDPKEAQRRFKSLQNGVLSKRYKGYIRVFERMKSGRIHFHLLVALSDDIRTGFDFNAHQLAVKARNRGDIASAKRLTAVYAASASVALKAQWKVWNSKRGVQLKYGFGRAEMLPVRKTAKDLARYIGKYIGKHVAARLAIDKGVRLVDYSKGARMASSRFSWNSPASRLHRRKLSWIAFHLQSKHGRLIFDFGDFKRYLGKRWARDLRDLLPQILLPFDDYAVCGDYETQCRYHSRDRAVWSHVECDDEAVRYSQGNALAVLWRIQRENGFDPDRVRPVIEDEPDLQTRFESLFPRPAWM